MTSIYEMVSKTMLRILLRCDKKIPHEAEDKRYSKDESQKRFAERKVFYQTLCYDAFQLLSSAIVGIPFSESGYIKLETFSRVHLV
uniref:Uncharacterized protein n=1 Tax=Candidatus Methanophagaceae archaeon ANME-1 ERB6 TaxID=2759912 RepID=A0A7G9YSN7_9EURY|nr:hypothetical protein EDLMLJLI_00014 [Methanosarcinales archaeon ANME-1 ERB6]